MKTPDMRARFTGGDGIGPEAAKVMEAASKEMNDLTQRLLVDHDRAVVAAAMGVVSIEHLKKQMVRFGLPQELIKGVLSLCVSQHKMIMYLIDADAEKVPKLTQQIREHFAVLTGDIDEAILKQEQSDGTAGTDKSAG